MYLYDMDIDEMTDREFEIYLLLIERDTQREVSDAIWKSSQSTNRTLWTIWGTSLGIGILCGLIISISN